MSVAVLEMVGIVVAAVLMTITKETISEAKGARTDPRLP